MLRAIRYETRTYFFFEWAHMGMIWNMKTFLNVNALQFTSYFILFHRITGIITFPNFQYLFFFIICCFHSPCDNSYIFLFLFDSANLSCLLHLIGTNSSITWLDIQHGFENVKEKKLKAHTHKHMGWFASKSLYKNRRS